MEEAQLSERIKMLLSRRKWQIQELKLKRTKSQTAGKNKEGEDVLVDQSVSRKRVVRKCEFPEREEADNAIKFLTSDACLDYLRLCGAELNQTVGEDADAQIEWVPIQAWYSEEDATNQHARKGILYHVLKIRGDDGKGEGPYETQDGCKYKEEYTFFWDVDAPPEVPKGRSGVQYELDVKRREDEDGLGGLYDCVLVKRTTMEQDVEPYDAHMELGETQVVAQMLGVSDESDLVIDDKGTKGQSIADKLSAFAEEHGLKTEDGVVKDDDDKVLHGMVVDITKEKNADCTTSITIRNTKEEENKKSTVVAEVTVRSIKTTTVDENVPAEADEEYELNPDGSPKLDGDGNPVKSKYPQVEVKDGVVTRKTVTKTKGGVRTIQIETEQGVKIDGGNGTKICEKTFIEHQHTTVAEAQDAAKEPTDVSKPAANGNGTYSKIQSTLREDGKWDIQETITEEISVADYVKHTSLTGTQFSEDVTNKNSTIDGTHLSTTNVVPGYEVKDVQVQRTLGGAYDVRTITRKPIKKAATIPFDEVIRGRSKSKETLFVFENHTLTEITAEALKYHGGSLRVNEFGLYDGQFTKTDYTTISDNDTDDPNEKKYWNAALRHDEDVVTMNGDVWQRTTYWIDVDAYTDLAPKAINRKLAEAKALSITAANRNKTIWAVKAESPRWYIYKSLTTGAEQPPIGNEYTVEQFGGTSGDPSVSGE